MLPPDAAASLPPRVPHTCKHGEPMMLRRPSSAMLQGTPEVSNWVFWPVLLESPVLRTMLREVAAVVSMPVRREQSPMMWSVLWEHRRYCKDADHSVRQACCDRENKANCMFCVPRSFDREKQNKVSLSCLSVALVHPMARHVEIRVDRSDSWPAD